MTKQFDHIVMGIDPGFGTCGCSVIYWRDGKMVDYKIYAFKSLGLGVKKRRKLKCRKVDDDIRRIELMVEWIVDILKENPGVEVCGFETFGIRPGRLNGVKALMGIGVFVAILILNKIEVMPFVTGDIKRFVGNVKAEKEDVQNFLMTNYGVDVSQHTKRKGDYEHMADSFILALLTYQHFTGVNVACK